MAAVVTPPGVRTRARREALGGASVFAVVLPELFDSRLGCCARTKPGRINAKRISATSAGENLFFTETSLIVKRSEIKTGEPLRPGDMLIGILTDAREASKVAPGKTGLEL